MTLAFEPDPAAFYELESNHRANAEADWASRLHISNRAIAASSGSLKIGSLSRGGDSMSSALFADAPANWEVEATTLADVLEKADVQDRDVFVKLDIEGGEYALLPALAEWMRSPGAAAHVSVHPHFLFQGLLPDRGDGGVDRTLRRIALLWHHARLLWGLKFKYLYKCDGRRLRRLPELWGLFMRGEFSREILAVNRQWRGSA